MRKSYFLISVSNRRNLDLCIRYSLAGFTNSINGAWTFLEAQEGDYISFLYGAKAFNLYVVRVKEAIENAETIPPWEPITFRQSGRTYYFPFRLHLTPVRGFEESLVRAEFAYVAENLLLRGGYRKTHFQADQTTLQAVSEMGNLWSGYVSKLEAPSYSTFVPLFTARRENQHIPEVFQLHEFILQSLIRRYLCDSDNLQKLLSGIEIKDISAENFEVLGEKAFPEGLVDILIKEAIPIGMARKIIVEVKAGAAKKQDLTQLSAYRNEIAEECIAIVLIARKFGSQILKYAERERIKLVRYAFARLDEANGFYKFDELLGSLGLEIFAP